MLMKLDCGWPISNEVSGGSIGMLELLPEEKSESLVLTRKLDRPWEEFRRRHSQIPS